MWTVVPAACSLQVNLFEHGRGTAGAAIVKWIRETGRGVGP
jgi:hypothetical protein